MKIDLRIPKRKTKWFLLEVKQVSQLEIMVDLLPMTGIFSLITVVGGILFLKGYVSASVNLLLLGMLVFIGGWFGVMISMVNFMDSTFKQDIHLTEAQAKKILRGGIE